MGKTTKMEQVEVASLRPYERNAKLHPRDQIEKLKRSIEEFGFLSPCLIDKDRNIIAGHGRVQAAKEQANDLADTLGDAAEMLADKVVVRNNRDCVINVYMKK